VGAATISWRARKEIGEMTKNNNTLLKWTGILNLAKNGNPAPARKVVQTDAEWRA
jgi:hypothetical protein